MNTKIGASIKIKKEFITCSFSNNNKIKKIGKGYKQDKTTRELPKIGPRNTRNGLKSCRVQLEYCNTRLVELTSLVDLVSFYISILCYIHNYHTH